MSGPGFENGEGTPPEENGEGTPPEEDDDGYRRRFPRWAVILLVVVVLAGGGLGLGLGLTARSTPAPGGPEGVPVQNVPDLAPASSTVSGAPVDGITCRPAMDQGSSFHIHDHVDIFVNGQQKRLPAGAGIAAPRLAEHLTTGLFVDNSPSGCLYWLHVHSNDGIIHIEAPHKGAFTLGQFFDIWGQPLSSDQVGPARGTVVAFVNGRVFHGDPRDIPLLVNGSIQLDVGTPVVPFQPIQFKVTGLCGSGTSNCSTSGS